MFSLCAALFGSACGLVTVAIFLLTIGSTWEAALIVAAASWAAIERSPPPPEQADALASAGG